MGDSSRWSSPPGRSSRTPGPRRRIVRRYVSLLRRFPRPGSRGRRSSPEAPASRGAEYGEPQDEAAVRCEPVCRRRRARSSLGDGVKTSWQTRLNWRRLPKPAANAISVPGGRCRRAGGGRDALAPTARGHRASPRGGWRTSAQVPRRDTEPRTELSFRRNVEGAVEYEAHGAADELGPADSPTPASGRDGTGGRRGSRRPRRRRPAGSADVLGVGRAPQPGRQ